MKQMKTLIRRAHGLLLAASLVGAVAAHGEAQAPGEVGSMAYEFSGLKGLDGKTYSLKDYRGKVVLLFVMQYNCGGCKANAPTVGKLAAKFQDKAFQAFAPDIAKGTAPQLQTFDVALRRDAPTVNFPILSGIPDSQIVSAAQGGVWKNYNSLRDVFFVIDHTGKIVARADGNRGNSMTAAEFTRLETAINTALNAIPTAVKPGISSRKQDGYSAAVSGVDRFDLRGRSLVGFGKPSRTLVATRKKIPAL